jgi:hypothetical protein
LVEDLKAPITTIRIYLIMSNRPLVPAALALPIVAMVMEQTTKDLAIVTKTAVVQMKTVPVPVQLEERERQPEVVEVVKRGSNEGYNGSAGMRKKATESGGSGGKGKQKKVRNFNL